VTTSGSGTLTLSGNLDYTGSTYIGNGTSLQLLNAFLNGDIYDAGSLVFNNSSLLTYGHIISGSGAVTKSGGGMLTLSGTNTYTGSTIISGGTLKVGSSSAIPSDTGKGNVTVNDTLDLNGNSIIVNGLSGSGTVTSNVAGAVTRSIGANNQSSTFSGTIQSGSGTVGVTKIDSGTLTLSGNNTYSGTTAIDAGILQIGNGGSGGTLGTGQVIDNGMLEFYRSNTLTVNNVISGSGGVRQDGAGTLILTGASTYTGGTTVIGGMLDIEGSIVRHVVLLGGGVTGPGAPPVAALRNDTPVVTLYYYYAESSVTFSNAYEPGTDPNGTVMRLFVS